MDLNDPRAVDRSRDVRFLERVFTREERERIRRSGRPDLEVWLLWAAKEAAFKVISKLQGEPPVFRHRAFQVTDDPGSAVTEVRYGEARLAVEVEADTTRALAWAWNGGMPEILIARATVPEALRILGLGPVREEWEAVHLRPEERESIHSLPSALVRLLARRDAARMLGVGERDLTIVCAPGVPGRRPPFVYRGGSLEAALDISLSHHGGELAWAVRAVRTGRT